MSPPDRRRSGRQPTSRPGIADGAVGSVSVQYGDYAKDRSGWFFGLTGAQLALIVLGGFPGLVALNSQAWLLVAVVAAGLGRC